MTSTEEWEHVGSPDTVPSDATSKQTSDTEGPCNALKDFLSAKGLAMQAEKIIEVTEAASLDDLRLIDESMMEEIIAAAGLKLITAKKFRLAIAELCAENELHHGATTGEDSPTTPRKMAKVSAAQPPKLQECVAICIDHSGSMRTQFSTDRTRMEAVKQMFYAFRDRTDNVGRGSHQLGLVQFDDEIDRMLDLTNKLGSFESVIDEMQTRGRTAIYSAILEGVRMLEPRFAEHPDADLRIVVLTDGLNNAGISPQEALSAVNSIGAVVDAIIVADKPDPDLRRIVTATDGQCFLISDLGEGFELLEAESVVSLRARRGGTEKPPFKPREMVELVSVKEKAITNSSAVHNIAQTVPNPALSTKVVSLSSLNAEAAKGLPKTVLVRVTKELNHVSSNPGQGIYIFPSQEAINLWRVLLEGPEQSPFEGGIFALTVNIPNDYPFKPPKIKFETPIYHCNVNDMGSICLDILQDQWSPGLTVPKALEAIRAMMKHPDTNNALRQWIAELTLAHVATEGRDTRYFDNARESTQKHASLDLDGWKQKWGCETGV